jgi:hypothetical protein
VPSVNGLSPALGPSKGGTEVSITGSSLSAATAVYFGVTPAASFKVVSDSLITAVAPPHDPAETAVTVETPLGSSIDSALDRFTFQSANTFGIILVTWKGSSSTLQLTGFKFDDRCSVRINSVPVPKVKVKHYAGDLTNALVTGGAALKAMLPKGRNVLITLENPGDTLQIALGIFCRK